MAICRPRCRPKPAPSTSSKSTSGATAPRALPPTETRPGPAASPDATEDDLTDEELERAIEAVDSRPRDYDAQFKMGEALLRIVGRPRDAIVYYQRASVLRPDLAEPLAGLGDARVAVAALAETPHGDVRPMLERAVEAYDSAIRIEPRNASLVASRGTAYSLLDAPRMDRAIADYRKALAIDSANEMAAEGLVVALVAAGRRADAERTLAAMEKSHPGSAALARARAVLAAPSTTR